MRKVRKPGICTFPVQNWFGHFGQRLVNLLGFDFLACQVGEQHLSANPNGCGKSNNSQEMCFESEAPCSDVRDDAASRKPVYLCGLRRSISKGSPVSLPESQFLHWRVQNHSRGSSWGLQALPLILPSSCLLLTQRVLNLYAIGQTPIPTCFYNMQFITLEVILWVFFPCRLGFCFQ